MPPDGWGILVAAHRWSLLAVAAVGAMVPWYTLQVFPLVTIGTAKINIEDALVAFAALCAGPAIVRAIRSGPRELLWVCAFIAYMAVPLLLGLRDPEGAFYAVRESRALAFYVLALVFATANYGARDFRNFAAVYVAATCVSSIAVFLHLHRVIPLPGYLPNMGFVARYLDWTVPVVAFTLALAGALGAETGRGRLAWAAALPFLAWYLIAMQERTAQGLTLGIAIVLLSLPRFGGLTVRRVATVAAMLAVVFALSVRVIPGPAWLSGPVEQMIGHWSRALTDDSLMSRWRELQAGLPRFALHPLLGEGLGGLISNFSPDYPFGPDQRRSIASGYGFLLIKTGLIGFALYAAMVLAAVRRGVSSLREDRERGAWPRIHVGLVGLAALLALNLLHTVADIPEGAIAFSLFFGMLVTREDDATP